MRHRKRRRKNPMVLGNPKRRRHARRNAKSHRKHRRNPFVLGNPYVLGNPRGRSSRRRRSYSRNPFSVAKLGLPPAREILYLGLGAFAGRLAVPLVLAKVPMLSTNPLVRAASRLGLVAVAGIAAKMVFKQNARMFVYGVLANQAPEIVNDVLSMTGMKLSDGNQELELYTGADPYQVNGGRGAAPALSMYTLNEGEESMTY